LINKANNPAAASATTAKAKIETIWPEFPEPPGAVRVVVGVAVNGVPVIVNVGWGEFVAVWVPVGR